MNTILGWPRTRKHFSWTLKDTVKKYFLKIRTHIIDGRRLAKQKDLKICMENHLRNKNKM